jgi:hypothetical protein
MSAEVGVSVAAAVEEPGMAATTLSDDVKEITKVPSTILKDIPYAPQAKSQKYSLSFFKNLSIYVPGRA